eukprot:Gb_35995 [translate_table: standard]
MLIKRSRTHGKSSLQSMPDANCGIKLVLDQCVSFLNRMRRQKKHTERAALQGTGNVVRFNEAKRIPSWNCMPRESSWGSLDEEDLIESVSYQGGPWGTPSGWTLRHSKVTRKGQRQRIPGRDISIRNGIHIRKANLVFALCCPVERSEHDITSHEELGVEDFEIIHGDVYEELPRDSCILEKFGKLEHRFQFKRENREEPNSRRLKKGRRKCSVQRRNLKGRDLNGGPITNIDNESAPSASPASGTSSTRNLDATVSRLRSYELQEQDCDKRKKWRLEAEVKGLKQQAELDMSEIKRLQILIDSEMPVLQEQLQSVKNVLNDLNVSDTLYSELMARPIESRTVREHILVLAYEKTQKSRVNVLCQERYTSREVMVRANDENQKLRREMQRITPTTTTEKKELELEIATLVARNERLESELRDAIVCAELLFAKGALYDEVKENLEKLEHSTKETEKQRMSFETGLKAAMHEKRVLLKNIRNKEQSLKILRLDKAYLTKKPRFFNCKGITNQAEIFRMQEKANEDIENIRKEACESTNRVSVIEVEAPSEGVMTIVMDTDRVRSEEETRERELKEKDSRHFKERKFQRCKKIDDAWQLFDKMAIRTLAWEIRIFTEEETTSWRLPEDEPD